MRPAWYPCWCMHSWLSMTQGGGCRRSPQPHADSATDTPPATDLAALRLRARRLSRPNQCREWTIPAGLRLGNETLGSTAGDADGQAPRGAQTSRAGASIQGYIPQEYYTPSLRVSERASAADKSRYNAMVPNPALLHSPSNLLLLR